MPELAPQGFPQQDPGIWDYKLIGTAAGTTTIQSSPCRLGGIFFPTRVAAATLIIYDSAGTSANVIGTITMGTQTFSDAPPVYWIPLRTQNGLTVVNSANQGCTVLYK